VAFVRRCQEVLLCWTESFPAGSKTNPLLAKAEAISNVIAYLRRVKNTAQQQPGERSENRWEQQTLRSVKEGEVLQTLEQRFPCSL